MGATDKTEKLKLPVYESLTTGTNQLKKSQRIKIILIFTSIFDNEPFRKVKKHERRIRVQLFRAPKKAVF
jgi:hypothetical protein